jgi:hypothetical protein
MLNFFFIRTDFLKTSREHGLWQYLCDPRGPYHHYCKGIQGGEVLQCLLFESTKPDAKLVGVEYFIEKNLARKNVPLIQWNRAFHDHEVEIAGGCGNS